MALLAQAAWSGVPWWLWITWATLGAVSLVLLGVLLSPWGQSRRLRKCVLISLMVHALLLTYAATVEIVQQYQGTEQTVAIRIVEVSAPHLPSEPSSADPLWEVKEPPEVKPSELELGESETTFSGKALQVQKPPQEQLPGPDLPQQPPEVEPPEELFSRQSVSQVASSELTSSGPAPAVADVPPPQPATPRKEPQLQRPKLQEPPQEDAPKVEQFVASEVARSSSTETAFSLPEVKTEAESLELEKASVDELPSPELPPLLPNQPVKAPVQAVLTPVPRELAPSLSPSEAQPPHGQEPSLARDQGRLVPVRVPLAPELDLPVPAALARRRDPERMRWVVQGGGSQQTESAIQSALAWLAAQQSAQGSWSAQAHGGGRDVRTLGHRRPGAGTRAETGITGLALLAFLGAGHTHLQGPYKDTVAQGLHYLLDQQAPDGSLSGRATLYAAMYCHAMATLAVAEAYLMSGDPRLRLPLEKAIQYTQKAQHPKTGGWRYRPGDALGDTSQLGWQLMVLHCGRMAQVPVPDQTWQAARRFLKAVSSGSRGGLAAYQIGHRPSPTMTAEALFCRVLLGTPRDDPSMQEAADYLMQHLPQPHRPNYYYWYYGTLGLYHLQGPRWERWNRALTDTLLRLQEKQGADRGSWPERSAWGGYGGRVFTTSLAVMCLEVYYRYVPAYAQAPAKQVALQPQLPRR